MQRPRFDDEFTDLAALAYRVAYRILGDRSSAEDIAQESLARAYLRWTKISTYRQAWVARVSGNLAIDLIRRRKRSVTEERPLDAEVLMIERLDLQRALLRLPKRHPPRGASNDTVGGEPPHALPVAPHALRLLLPRSSALSDHTM
jgi:DNA-directed RNA polymerase specialized sigma24 family protein